MATATVQHVYTATQPDGSHPGLLQPSNWNSNHNITIDGVVGTNFAGTNASATLNSNGMSLSVAPGGGGALTVNGVSNGAIVVAGTTTAATNCNITVNSDGINVSVNAGGAGDGYNPAQFTNATANSTQNIVWAGNSGGSGNVTLGLTGSTVTMQAPVGGAGGATVNGSTGNVTLTVASSLVMSTNGSTISFGLDPNITNTLFPAANTTKFAGAGFTSASTAGSDLIVTHNSLGLSMGVPKYLTTTLAQTLQPSASVVLSGSNASVSATAFTFGNSNNNSFYITNGSIVGSYSQSIQTQNSVLINGGSGAFTLAGTSTGSQSTTGTDVNLTVNSNGINLGIPAYITTAGAGGVTSGAYYVTQNSTGGSSSGTYALSSLNIIGAGVASVGNSGNSLVISVPSGGGAGDGYNIVSAGSTGTTGTAWSSLSASIGINGSGAITVSQNNSNQLVINAPAMSVLSAVTNCTLGTTGSTIGISVAAGGGGGAAIQGSGTYNQSTGTVQFANSNNVTFGLSSNGVMTASASFNQTLDTADIQYVQLAGNTTFAGGNSSILSATNEILSIAGGNNITLSGAANAITISGPNNNISLVGNIIAGSASTIPEGTNDSIYMSATGNISIGGNGSNVVFSVPNQPIYYAAQTNTSGAVSTVGTASTIQFGNSNGATLYQTNGSIVASYTVPAAGGTSFATASYYQNLPWMEHATQTQSLANATNATNYVAPFFVPVGVSASYIRIPVSMNVGSTSFASTANTAFSMSHAQTIYAVVYSQGAGASSRSLQSVASGSAGISQQVSVTYVSNTGNANVVTHNITYPLEGNNTNAFATNYTFSNGSIQVSSTHLTIWTGSKFVDIPFANYLAPGAYWIAFGRNQATSTQAAGVAALTAASIGMSTIMVSQNNFSMGLLGFANTGTAASSVGLQVGLGSIAMTGAQTTASIALSNISSSASQMQPFFMMIRQA